MVTSKSAALNSKKGWLHARLVANGGGDSPAASFHGTANWVRALAILCKEDAFTAHALKNRYKDVRRRSPTQANSDTAVFEGILKSFQNLAAVSSISRSNDCVDLSHMAVVAWYYSVYNSASAMIAANDGSEQSKHHETANCWDRQLVQNKLACPPFDFRCSSLVETTYKAEIEARRNGRELFPVHNAPRTAEDAESICLSHLAGTVRFERDRHKEMLLKRELKKLGLENFKTKEARRIRDERFENKAVGFLHQAIRHRGKANYRDALYLSYGVEHTDVLGEFIEDLRTVAEAFLKMATHYSARRVEKGSWDSFVQDVAENSRLSLSAELLKA